MKDKESSNSEIADEQSYENLTNVLFQALDKIGNDRGPIADKIRSRI